MDLLFLYFFVLCIVQYLHWNTNYVLHSSEPVNPVQWDTDSTLI